ncbi:hybrid sensor histidine kinase/response regulator [Paracoccus alkenifer]|uniref:histidine kinase n=1 Tax=Paracoccus alkenifer TaxID=65735 RepID=A0A1H6JS28_9RHOB|nr:ATP-binding protein [Paracoccus alkenifer]SEH65312.1 two-component system, cell cycle sensor histidine kinase and response regulator CckA [Paracoccus alkenifer]
MKDNALLLSRGLAAVPVLMLPMALGALWLALQPNAVSARALVIGGGVAVAWYLLAGLMVAQQVVQHIRIRRQLRRVRPVIAEQAGCAWIVDAQGAIRAQSPQAEQFLDMAGRDAAALLSRHRASPATAAQALLRRIGDGRPCNLPLQDGARLIAQRIPGTTLQLWRIEMPAPAPEPPAPAVSIPETGHGYRDLPIAILEFEPSGRMIEANPAAEALLGPVRPGSHLGNLVDGLGRPLEDWIAEVHEGRDNGRAEVLQTRGEVERDLQISLVSTADAQRMVAVLTDVSALKSLEAQFTQSQKMQAIGQLAGGIAHDFNNLLTAISGHCDLLMVQRDNADPDYADLHQISENANRAAALVRQLLAFSRKQTLTPEIIDLRDSLSDLSHLLNRLVGEKTVVTVTHDPELRPIRADARQLEQVLMNLVVNGRDAMADGGEITISTENVHLESGLTLNRVNIPKGEYVRITVSDQGSGISPEILDKIFDPFFTTKKQGEGTGLGLSTAYGIVKQTGGYIFCRSILGEGTKFTLYFPAQNPRQTAVAAPGPPPLADELPGEDRRTILLVEDEAPVRAFASRALRLHGYEVIEAESGERALEILDDAALAVDLFVTDVVMPGMDGPSWVREALRKREHTPVIFMSGYMETDLGSGSRAIPNAIFVAKPFSLSELAASVGGHLTAHPPRTEQAVPGPVV